MPTLRVWIDTDVGSDVDDALAIAYALRHPALQLVGVSTVFGDVALRTRIARALLALAGADDVPVVTGLGAPLTPGRFGRMFGHEGLGIVEDPAPVMRVDRDPDAEARIAALAAALERARADALVSIGPMTNVAALSDAGHGLPALTIMGGKTRDVELPGRPSAIPEWNWWCDPRAVASSLQAATPAPAHVVPIEVTARTFLTDDDLAQLAGGDPLARTLHGLCGHWLTALRDRLGSPSPRVALHDPLAVATLVEPGLAPFETRHIRIDDAGVTHAEPDGARIRVATDVDNDVLRAHLLDTWLA